MGKKKNRQHNRTSSTEAAWSGEAPVKDEVAAPPENSSTESVESPDGSVGNQDLAEELQKLKEALSCAEQDKADTEARLAAAQQAHVELEGTVATLQNSNKQLEDEVAAQKAQGPSEDSGLLDSLKQELDVKAAALEDVQQDLVNKESALLNAQEELEKTRKELAEKAQAAPPQTSAIGRMLIQRNQEIQSLKAQNAQLKEQLAGSPVAAPNPEAPSETSKKLEEELNEAKLAVEKMGLENAELKKQLATVPAAAQNSQADTDSLEEELQTLRQKLVEAEKQADSAAELERERNFFQAQTAQLESRLQAKTNQVEKLEKDSRRWQEDVASLQTQLAQMYSRPSQGLQIEEDPALKERIEELESILQEKDQEIASLTTKLARLEGGSAQLEEQKQELEWTAGLLANKESLIERLEGENLELQRQVSDLQDKMAGASMEASATSSIPNERVSALERELELVQLDVQERDATIEALKAQVEQSQAASSDVPDAPPVVDEATQVRLVELENAVRERDAHINAVQAYVEATQAQYAQQMAAMEAKVDAKQKQIEDLQAGVVAEQNQGLADNTQALHQALRQRDAIIAQLQHQIVGEQAHPQNQELGFRQQKLNEMSQELEQLRQVNNLLTLDVTQLIQRTQDLLMEREIIADELHMVKKQQSMENTPVKHQLPPEIRAEEEHLKYTDLGPPSAALDYQESSYVSAIPEEQQPHQVTQPAEPLFHEPPEQASGGGLWGFISQSVFPSPE